MSYHSLSKYLSNYLYITYILVMSQCYIPNQPGLTFLIRAALRRRPAWLARDSPNLCPMAPWLNTAFYTFLKGPKYVHGVYRHIMYLKIHVHDIYNIYIYITSIPVLSNAGGCLFALNRDIFLECLRILGVNFDLLSVWKWGMPTKCW